MSCSETKAALIVALVLNAVYYRTVNKTARNMHCLSLFDYRCLAVLSWACSSFKPTLVRPRSKLNLHDQDQIFMINVYAHGRIRLKCRKSDKRDCQIVDNIRLFASSVVKYFKYLPKQKYVLLTYIFYLHQKNSFRI